MTSTLIQKFDMTIAVIREKIQCHKLLANDPSIYKLSLQLAWFQDHFDGPISGFSVEKAFEFASRSPEEFDRIARYHDIKFEGNIVSFVSKVFERALYEQQSEDFCQSQDVAEQAFADAAEVFGTFLPELSSAEIRDYIEFHDHAIAAGWDGVSTYISERLFAQTWIGNLEAFVEQASMEFEDFAAECKQRRLEVELFQIGGTCHPGHESTHNIL